MAIVFKDIKLTLEGADNVYSYEILANLCDDGSEEAAKRIFLLGLETAIHRMENYPDECEECSQFDIDI